MTSPTKQVLTIAKGTDESLTGTNQLYVNPKVFAALCPNAKFAPGEYPTVEVIPQAPEFATKTYYFQLNTYATVTDSGIVMNAVQRKMCGREGDQVLVRRVMVTSLPPADTIVFSVQKLGKSSQQLTLNIGEVRPVVHGLYDNQIFSDGQTVIFKFGGDAYQLTIKRATITAAAGSNPQDSILAALMPAKAITGEKSPYYSLHPSTELQFETTPESKIKLTGARTMTDILKKGITPKDMGIGGLNDQFATIIRRAFLSRTLTPELAASTGVKHIRGIMLFGPPGTGKTLIARQIGQLLHTREPKVVSGPQILNKFVGQSEENVRNLFIDAEKDYADNGEAADLHLIIFDEIDAICKARGSTSGGTGVGDSVVNQLLAKMDGVNSLNNVIVIGMTNRLDMIDSALLRPGRFEVHVEVALPDEAGRLEILDIHTSVMKKGGHLAPDVNLEELAKETKNYTGAELEGVVKSALSRAIARKRTIEEEASDDPKGAALPSYMTSTKASTSTSSSSSSASPSSACAPPAITPGMMETLAKAGYRRGQPVPILVMQPDFMEAIKEVVPQLGVEETLLERLMAGGVINYGRQFTAVVDEVKKLVRFDVDTTRKQWTRSMLLAGKAGTGKTTLAALVAKESGYPFVRFLTPEWLNTKARDTRSIIAALQTVFSDALKSPLSMIVFDKFESFIRLTRRGSFDEDIAQFIEDWIGTAPLPGHRLFVIATTSRYDDLSDHIGGLDALTQEAATRRGKNQGKEGDEEGMGMAPPTTDPSSVIGGFRSVVVVPGLTEGEEVEAALRELEPKWPQWAYAAIGGAILVQKASNVPIRDILDLLDTARADNADESWRPLAMRFGVPIPRS